MSVLQFAEGLPNRKAADEVRGQIDWKYALGVELTDPGFDASVLSESCARLVTGMAERLLLDALLECGRQRDWLKARGRQRTDSTRVLAGIRALNRVEVVVETTRHALDSPAIVAPEWLVTVAVPERAIAKLAVPRTAACRLAREPARR